MPMTSTARCITNPHARCRLTGQAIPYHHDHRPRHWTETQGVFLHRDPAILIDDLRPSQSHQGGQSLAELPYRRTTLFRWVTFVLVPDNDTAVIYRLKKNYPARAVNAEYGALAKFYNTAVIPTDVRAPQQKAGVERSVQIIYSHGLGVLEMEGPFHSLDQIEEIIADQIHEINYGIVRIDGTSRDEQFQAEERHLLIPLPDQDYTSYQRKELKVQCN